jgi:hypothetical protein
MYKILSYIKSYLFSYIWIDIVLNLEIYFRMWIIDGVVRIVYHDAGMLAYCT